MKAASVNEIKQELKNCSQAKLVELCLRLARYKNENKELLTYLLFEADDLALYIKQVNEAIDEGFGEVSTGHVYFAKKTIRKVLRLANKHIRYTGSKTAEAEILIHFLASMKGLQVSWKKSTALVNLYQAQLKKIRTAIGTMHEDLQRDYLKELKRLEL